MDDRDAIVVIGVAVRAEHHRPEAQLTDRDTGPAEDACLAWRCSIGTRGACARDGQPADLGARCRASAADAGTRRHAGRRWAVVRPLTDSTACVIAGDSRLITPSPPDFTPARRAARRGRRRGARVGDRVRDPVRDQLPALPSPGPETSELGRSPEPPAVVNLLVNRCHVTSAAAAATLIDLAARGHLELSEVGPDRYVVRLRRDRDEPLTDYEEQVSISCVHAPSVDRRRSRRSHSTSRRRASWRDQLRASGSLRTPRRAVSSAAGGPRRLDRVRPAGGGGAAAARRRSRNRRRQAGQSGRSTFGEEDWFFVALAAWFGVLAVLRSLRSVRYSAAGEAVTARWLGVKRYLQHDQQFGEIAPAGVAVWDRLLAYGAALGSHAAPRPRSRSRSRIPTPRGVAWVATGIRCTSSTRPGSDTASARSTCSSTARSAACSSACSRSWAYRSSSTWCGRPPRTRSTTGATARRSRSWCRSPRSRGRSASCASSGSPMACDCAFRGLADLRATATVTGQVVKHHHAESVVVVRGRSGRRR